MENIILDNTDILKYIGASDTIFLNSDIEKKIEECKKNFSNTISPRFIYESFEIETLNQIKIKQSNVLLYGKSIYTHLKKSNKVIFVSATLGNNLDKLIREKELTDILEALILDSCGTVFLENYRNKIEEHLVKTFESKNLFLTNYISPGFGDFDLSNQQIFLKVLNANKKIGLSVTSHNILLPKKSITFLFGISNMIQNKKAIDCSSCFLFKKCLNNSLCKNKI